MTDAPGPEWKTETIEVTLDDLFHSLISEGLEGFLDLISERAFGTQLAEEIDYKLLGVKDSYTFQLEVTAALPESGTE